jgi:hypothetical protein
MHSASRVGIGVQTFLPYPSFAESARVLDYGAAICQEWIRRGYVDTVAEKLRVHERPDPAVLPPWFGDERSHASHRSNLLRKDPEFYGK